MEVWLGFLTKKGQIILESNSGDEDVVFEAALEAGAEDFEADDGFYTVTTDPTLLMDVRDTLEKTGYEIRSAEIELVPKTLQKLEGKEAQSALKLMDALEDNDDITKLYSNFNVDEEALLQE